jgi:hypothetical protein
VRVECDDGVIVIVCGSARLEDPEIELEMTPVVEELDAVERQIHTSLERDFSNGTDIDLWLDIAEAEGVLALEDPHGQVYSVRTSI